MHPVRGVRTILEADSPEGVDWPAVNRSARHLSKSGTLDLTPGERDGYATDARIARARIEDATGLAVSLPETLEVQHRHHWIDRTAETLERAFEPIPAEPSRFPGLRTSINTGTVAGALAHVSGLVLGQYDPKLFDRTGAHELLVVHPNVREAARDLAVEPEPFRRWIVFHEVAHAAEFDQAPWLAAYLAERVNRVLDGVATGEVPRQAFRELDLAMTAVEGYAELLMDAAFDGPTGSMRTALDERRAQSGPVAGILGRVLGLDRKRAQYERGRAFFAAIAEQGGIAAANRAWERPQALPREAELEDPDRWLERVDRA
ncbi:MAG: zinc-dependent metalloprotease [Halodesulfurarchaeum sp.]